MAFTRKTYKVYANEDGYRFSCRIKGCTGMGSGFLTRDAAEKAGTIHYEASHIERDKELEDWILNLGN